MQLSPNPFDNCTNDSSWYDPAPGAMSLLNRQQALGSTGSASSAAPTTQTSQLRPLSQQQANHLAARRLGAAAVVLDWAMSLQHDSFTRSTYESILCKFRENANSPGLSSVKDVSDKGSKEQRYPAVGWFPCDQLHSVEAMDSTREGATAQAGALCSLGRCVCTVRGC